jgi:N-acetyl sugar amidotransferase
MDTSASDISFNELGICNYCEEFVNYTSLVLNDSTELKKKKLDELVLQIKRAGQFNKYDCVVGISGGVDSSWMLKKTIDLGLRPLAVHMDNGWNSELAQNNISNLIKTLKIDLYTWVIEWDEYRNLMNSFFQANVIDIELLYDNAMMAANYRIAKKFGIKYILGGFNISTEGIKGPPNWNWYKFDKRNIKSISTIFGKQKLKTFPSISTIDLFRYTYFGQIRWLSILDLIDYNKDEALSQLEKNFSFKPYPYKHYESVFTRFYQGFILPTKFGIDKRRLHLSTLILSNHLSRSDALELMRSSPYGSNADLEIDKEYFLKKMKWSKSELDTYLQNPEISHLAYKSEKPFRDFLFQVKNYLKI